MLERDQATAETWTGPPGRDTRPRKIGEVIILNDAEMALCEHIAGQRTGGGRSDLRMHSGPQSDYEVNRQGIGGELAFCRLFGIYPTEVFHIGTSVVDPGDAVLDGFAIDVKSLRKTDADLLVPGHKEVGEIPVHALMTGTFPTYRFRGFAWTRDVIVDYNVTDLGYGPTYLYPQSKLRSWGELHGESV